MTRTFPLRGRAGFTLTEMLVVVVIMTIMAALAGPRMAHWLRTLSSRTTADQVAADLSLARIQAVRNGRTASLRITNDHTYTITLDSLGTQGVSVIKTVDVSRYEVGTVLAPTSGRISFDSRGILRSALTSTDSVRITRGSSSRVVKITTVGRILRAD